MSLRGAKRRSNLFNIEAYVKDCFGKKRLEMTLKQTAFKVHGQLVYASHPISIYFQTSEMHEGISLQV